MLFLQTYIPQLPLLLYLISSHSQQTLSLSLLSLYQPILFLTSVFAPPFFFFQVQLHRLPPLFLFFGHGFLAFGDIKKKKNGKWEVGVIGIG